MIIKNIFQSERKEHLMIINFSENINKDNDDHDYGYDEYKDLYGF